MSGIFDDYSVQRGDAMNRWIVVAAWVSFAAITYLILGEAVAQWIGWPILGNIGFTLVFVLFALFHCVALEGVARTGIFFGVSAIVSYAMEEIGVRTGLIYGAYHYSDLLGQSWVMCRLLFRWPGS
jgi:uncharacterized membrane protein